MEETAIKAGLRRITVSFDGDAGASLDSEGWRIASPGRICPSGTRAAQSRIFGCPTVFHGRLWRTCRCYFPLSP